MPSKTDQGPILRALVQSELTLLVRHLVRDAEWEITGHFIEPKVTCLIPGTLFVFGIHNERQKNWSDIALKYLPKTSRKVQNHVKLLQKLNRIVLKDVKLRQESEQLCLKICNARFNDMEGLVRNNGRLKERNYATS